MSYDKAQKPVTREELELAVQSFEQMDGMAKYAQMMESAMNMMRDHFDMTERALKMVQSLHEKQLQGIDHWIDMCKFLLPLFVAIATAGLTLDNIATFNSQIATIIGSVGFLVFFAGLFKLSQKRQKLLSKQEKNIENLHKTFQEGQELVNILKAQAQDERGEMTDDKMREQLEKVLSALKRTKNE
ncbi:MAG: hypothetical protein WBK76_05050 [Candidatus Saccharimonadales bacterium]